MEFNWTSFLEALWDLELFTGLVYWFSPSHLYGLCIPLELNSSQLTLLHHDTGGRVHHSFCPAT